MNRLMTSYCYELKKLLFVRRGWLFLLAAVLLQIGIACFAKPAEPYAYDRGIYASYAERYGGVYSKQTEQTIHANAAAISTIIQQYDPTKPDFSEEREGLADRILLANMKYNALNALQTKYSRLASCKEMQPALTYDLELTDYIKKFGVSWGSLFGMLFLVPMLMLGDANCGMEQILFPSATGKHTIVCSKLLVAATLGIAVTAVCSVLQWGIFGLRWDFGALNVPIQSITGFEECTVHISVRSCIFLFGVIRILSAPAVAMLLCVLSSLIRKEPAIIATGAIVIGISAFLANKFTSLSVFFLFSTISGIGAVKLYTAPDILFLLLFLAIKTALFGCLAQSAATKKR